MRTLHLLRHAKSAWDQPGLSDRDRPLNKRGRRDAPRMGAALAQRVQAMVVHASPARRAQLTLAGLCEGWPAMAALAHVTDDDLYTFSALDLLDFIQARGDGGDALWLIGHNPALTELVNYLAPADYLANLPTAGYARLALDCDRWEAVREGCGRLQELLLPREL